jgi:hypothetical protein
VRLYIASHGGGDLLPPFLEDRHEAVVSTEWGGFMWGMQMVVTFTLQSSVKEVAKWQETTVTKSE